MLSAGLFILRWLAEVAALNNSAGMGTVDHGDLRGAQLLLYAA